MQDLVANPRVFTCAVLPLCAPFGLAFTGLPVSWLAAAMPAAVVALVLLLQRTRQRTMEKPAKIWRGYPRASFLIDVALVVIAALGILYATTENALIVVTLIVSITIGGGWAATDLIKRLDKAR